jgi:predicted methyltransferase
MRSLPRTLTAAALALLVVVEAAAQAPAAYRVPAAAPTNIKRAVESTARPAEQRARDADRKAAETLMLQRPTFSPPGYRSQCAERG